MNLLNEGRLVAVITSLYLSAGQMLGKKYQNFPRILEIFSKFKKNSNFYFFIV